MTYLSSLRIMVGGLLVLAMAAGHAAGVPVHRHDILPGPLPVVEVSTPLPSSMAPLPQGTTLSPASPQLGSAGVALTMRVLVVSADGTEPSFGAAMATLERMGIPAQAYIVRRDGPLTPEKLAQGALAQYYAVVLATSTLSYWNGSAHVSAFTPSDWETLAAFEARFHVRQVTMYAYPDAELGFEALSNRGMLGKSGHLTPEGRRVFTYLNPRAEIPIRGAWVYLARPASDAVPLVLTPDGDALAVVKTYPDGREQMVFTMDGNAALLHTRLLAPGAITWATRGLYLGERRVYLNAQVDDLFFEDDRYAGRPYRMTTSDLNAVLAWQQAIRTRPLTGAFRLAMAFNGEGSEHNFVNEGRFDEDGSGALEAEDALTNAVVPSEAAFEWISHTYGHTNLDSLTEQQAAWELQQNHRVAVQLGFTRYSRENLVTPDISGLSNPAAMLAAARHGVRYVVSDWSRRDQRARFNTGIRNVHDPRILEIPRYPTNIFYNVTEPGELLEEFAAVHPDFCGLFRDRCPLTYPGLIDFESDVMVGYLFTYDVNPLMFHQSNLRQYLGGRTLLADFLTAVVATYETLSALPIRTLTMEQIGRAMERRDAYNKAGVVGTLVPGERITITATSGPAVVPVTGVRVGTSVERYGAEDTSYVAVRRGQSMVIPIR